MDNRIKIFFMALLGMATAYALAIQVGEGNWYGAAVVGVGLLTIGVVGFLSRGAPPDGVILLTAVCAVMFTGKGFVYINVGGIIYVTEIVLAVLAAGYVVRMVFFRESIFPRSPFTLPICLLILYGFVHLYFDFSRFGFMALRDSGIYYYTAFFLATYKLAQNDAFRQAASRFLPKSALLAFELIGLTYFVPGFGGSLTRITSFGSYSLYSPHVDAGVPIMIGLLLYLVTQESSTKHPFFYFILCWTVFLVTFLTAKGTTLVALAGSLLFIVLCGRIWFLVRAGAMALIALGALTLLFLYAPERMPRQLEGVQSELASFAAPFEEKEVQSGNDATAKWRMAWWKFLYEKTMNQNPVFGLGLGQDIDIEFQRAYFGAEILAEQSRTRGAHSSLVTIFSRLGGVGAFFFFWIYGLQVMLIIKGTLYYRRLGANAPPELALYIGILIGGMAAAIFQYCWEAPYSAMQYWVVTALAAYTIDHHITKNGVPEKGESQKAATDAIPPSKAMSPA